MKATIPSQHILVVDDEPMVSDALRMLLTFDGHTIELANDGPDALKKLSKNKFDVVFTDLKMRGMLGDALARAIKTEYPQQVVVMGLPMEMFSALVRSYPYPLILSSPSLSASELSEMP